MALREDAFERANGHCECRMRWCSHMGECGQILRGAWELVRCDRAEPYQLSNVVVVCEACARRAQGSAVGPLPGF
jgi:hypothetical protein